MIEAKGRRIYIDPWEVKGENADIILITHPHYDHFNAEDVHRLKSGNTVIIAPPECREVGGIFKAAKPGSKFNEDGIVIEAVHAYNIHKDRLKFHPKEKNWHGFVIDVDGVHIYHAGDTDFIEEIKHLPEIDIAMIPCGGTYTMDALEAAKACNYFMPKIAVPMHWGKIVGNRKDADAFKQHFKGETKILE